MLSYTRIKFIKILKGINDQIIKKDPISSYGRRRIRLNFPQMDKFNDKIEQKKGVHQLQRIGKAGIKWHEDTYSQL